MLLVPLLSMPEATPLGVDSAESTSAPAEIRSASPEALQNGSAADPNAALTARHAVIYMRTLAFAGGLVIW